MTNHAMDYQIDISADTVLIKNQNTTIGYSRFNLQGEVEYIYVNPLYRRQGYGRLLIEEIKKITGPIAKVHEPISPLGAQFFTCVGLGDVIEEGKKN
jgi:GNAT superfamily N-acetyltransferase